MTTLYIETQGATLSKQYERLKVHYLKDTLADVPLQQVSSVVIFGRVNITPATVAMLCKSGIEICYLTQSGSYLGRTMPSITRNPAIRRLQFQAGSDTAATARIARAIVKGKLANMRTFLVRAQREEKDAEDPELGPAIRQIKEAEQNVLNETDLEKIRGYEGSGSAAYFSAFNSLILQKEFVFHGRTRRPPEDEANSLLSFGYTLLGNDVHSAVDVVGLYPYIGFLHADRYGRPSLAMDLMEEFRTLVVDAMVLSCINKRLLTVADFQKEFGTGFYLKDAAKKLFLEQYEAKKNQSFCHPQVKTRMTYRQAFQTQVRLLVKHLENELPEYVPLVMR